MRGGIGDGEGEVVVGVDAVVLVDLVDVDGVDDDVFNDENLDEVMLCGSWPAELAE